VLAEFFCVERNVQIGLHAGCKMDINGIKIEAFGVPPRLRRAYP
jgi:hypothetical protein